jgi:Zn-dependent protease with chaperone function
MTWRALGASLAALALAVSSLASAATPAPKPMLAPPYAGAYQPVGKDEIGLWQRDDEAEKHLAASSQLMNAPALTEYVRHVLCETVGADRCKGLRVYIIRDPMFNASMSPNGTLRVLSGLFLRVHNEAELGAILGHEFGHFEKRHTLAAFKAERSGASLLAWAAVLSAMASNYGYRDNHFDQMRVDVYGDIRHFQRNQEREADAAGVSYLNSSNLRPQAASQVWQTIMAEQNQSAAVRGLKKPDFRGVAFFADHPPEAERADTLARLALPEGSDRGDGAREYWEALSPWLPQLLNDQLKLNDFGGSDYLIQAMADANGWNAPLYFARGELYRMRGNQRDLTQAVEFYSQATARDSGLAEAYRGLGLAEIRLGMIGPGRESLKTYLTLQPEARDAAMIRSLLQSGGEN